MFQQGDIPVVPMPEVPQTENVESFWAAFKGMSFEQFVATISNSLISFCFRICIAILVFYIGRFLIGRIYKTVFNIMTRRKVDASLTTFVLSLVRISLYFILIIITIGILGIETTSFVAIFASAGVAIGMALSGTLQNFAGGVLILLLKPYKVGDFVEVQGYSGKVKSIQLFNTVINTVDNKAIILPNGALSTSSINNYSLEKYRRVDWSISLAYGTELKAAKTAILEIINSDQRTVKQYIEDDMELRRNLLNESDDEESVVNEESVEKRESLFHRMFHSRKKQIAAIANDNPLDLLPVAIPQKLDRSPFCGLQEMGDSAIVFTVRAWTHSSNYWDLYFEINERFYTELPAKGFDFPFPQMDVHLSKVNG